MIAHAGGIGRKRRTCSWLEQKVGNGGEWNGREGKTGNMTRRTNAKGHVEKASHVRM